MSFGLKGGSGSSKNHFTSLDCIETIFEKAEYEVRTVEQGDILKPDAIATPKSSVREHSFGDRTLAIEILSGTVTDATEILRRLQNAINADRQCVFVVPIGETVADKTRRAKALETVLHGRSSEETSVTDQLDDGDRDTLEDHPKIGIAHQYNGVQRYYQTTRELRVNNGKRAVQPRNATPGLWFRRENGRIEYRLVEETPDGQTDDEPYICFNDYEELNGGEPEFIGAVAERDSREYVVTEADGTSHRYGSFEMVETEWETVSMPFVPEIAFKHLPTVDDYDIIVVDLNASKGSGRVQLYDSPTDTAKNISL